MTKHYFLQLNTEKASDNIARGNTSHSYLYISAAVGKCYYVPICADNESTVTHAEENRFPPKWQILFHLLFMIPKVKRENS